MLVKTWTLIDIEQQQHAGPLAIGPAEAGGRSAGYAVHFKRLRGGLAEGVDVVEIDTGAMTVAVLPSRGMGLWKAWRPDGSSLGWKSPVKGPVHPAFVPLWEPSGIGWLSGFDELLVRCGLESNGAPEWDAAGKLKYPLHGKIANTPAHHLELSIDGDQGEIVLTGTVDEARLFSSKLRLRSTLRTRVGQSGLHITDEITNLSAAPGECELLYHINVGRPLMDEGAKVVLPLKRLAPRNARAAEGLSAWDHYGPPQTGFAEQVYFCELAADQRGQTQALLKNAGGTQGLLLEFNTRQLPAFTLWKSTQADEDGYVTGLEPGINFPNPRSYEQQQGRVARLRPGETLKMELWLSWLVDAASMKGAEAAIAKLQSTAAPRILEKPPAGWTVD